VSLTGQPETEEAKKTAGALKLPLSVYLFEPEDVEKTVSKVVGLIEEPDPVKAAVGVPFYWVAKETAKSGLNVLLAGQGADELFGGYQRYVNEYLVHGMQKVGETMFADVVRLHETNIERDEKICGFHGVELRLPFASFGIARFALSLPLELKVEKRVDGLRKLVLRRLAHNLGLPESVVNKPKKAVQYATGVNAVLGKIAKKRGLTVGAYVEKLFREQKI
jgi:asparagine synthase (glutamine-hydrolysing)